MDQMQQMVSESVASSAQDADVVPISVVALNRLRSCGQDTEHNEKKRDPNTNMWLSSLFREQYDGRVY
jgi:hypothetical protein